MHIVQYCDNTKLQRHKFWKDLLSAVWVREERAAEITWGETGRLDWGMEDWCCRPDGTDCYCVLQGLQCVQPQSICEQHYTWFQLWVLCFPWNTVCQNEHSPYMNKEGWDNNNEIERSVEVKKEAEKSGRL